MDPFLVCVIRTKSCRRHVLDLQVAGKIARKVVMWRFVGSPGVPGGLTAMLYGGSGGYNIMVT